MYLTHQVWLPQTLTGAKKLLARCPTDNEVLCEIDTADGIEPADEWLPGCVVDSGHHRTDKIRTKPPLVQGRADQIGKCLRGDMSFLTEAVHVDFVAEEIRNCSNVCCKTSQAKVDRGSVVEDLGEVVGYSQGLHA